MQNLLIAIVLVGTAAPSVAMAKGEWSSISATAMRRELKAKLNSTAITRASKWAVLDVNQKNGLVNAPWFARSVASKTTGVVKLAWGRINLREQFAGESRVKITRRELVR